MHSDTPVLNPLLYHRLKRAFGEVKLGNPGQAMVARTVTDVLTERPRLVISQAGEQYRVRCCYCGDRGFNLSVSHMWGQRDELGRPLVFLAHCHNRNCLAAADNREDLIERLHGRDGILEEAQLLPGRKRAPGSADVAGAGEVTRLDRLSRSHLTHRFLRRQGLNPDKVGRVYQVGYCEESRLSIARGRLIIPVREDGRLKGWQALRLDEPDENDDTPRYFNAPGMRRSRLLYNIDRAQAYETGVIVPEPLDVWAFGPMAVSAFGRAISEAQVQTFLAAFHRRTAVLLLRREDAGTAEMNETVRALTAGMSGGFAAVKLPADKEPASLGREVLRAHVARQAKTQGVRVRYSKRNL